MVARNQFYNRLNNTTRVILDVSVGGSFSKKNDIDECDILKEMESNNALWLSERVQLAKGVDGIHDLDVFTNPTTRYPS